MTTTDSRTSCDIDSSPPWNAEALTEVRAALQLDLDRLQKQVTLAEHAFGSHVGESVNDLGDDVGDISSLMVELDEGSSLANNDKDILRQTMRALERIDSSVYGSCEGCSKPIAKERMIALPRATHCISCLSNHREGAW